MTAFAFFLSGSPNVHPKYVNTTKKLSQQVAREKIKFIYGGAQNGLMGTLARTALQEGGEVIGVMSQTLQDREPIQQGITQLIWVDSIAQRITTMMELADAFIVLPGGLGTLEELFVLWNEIRLGLMNKPVAILNTHHFYTPFLAWIEKMQKEQFISDKAAAIPILAEDPKQLIAKIRKKLSDRT